MEPAAVARRPLFRGHVPRSRLTGLLDGTAARAIVLCAPAGYGKTVLAAEWALGRRRVEWYRATAASADLNAFAAGLAPVLDRIAPGAAAALEGGAGLPPRERVELVAPVLEAWPEDGVLAIDDYHLVSESRAAEELFDWLLTLATRLRVIVTTRTRPAWATARRLLYQEVLELGREQLAMTDDEAREVLSGQRPRPVQTALARAQGWPALVGLAALSAATDAPDAVVADTLYRYFAEEVLRREPPEMQQFMLRASVPATVDVATAAAALGAPNASSAIGELAAKGLLQPVGDGFRFHPLLRDFLRWKLRAEEPEAERDIAELASAAAAHAGRIEEAFELAVDAGRLDIAAATAAAHAGELLASSRDETLERWLDACGSLVLVHAPLLLARAAIMLRRGELAAAHALARDVAARVGADDPHVSRAWYLAAQALNLLSERSEALAAAERARETAKTAQDRMNALLLCAITAGALEVDEEPYLDELRELAADDLHARLRLASATIWCAFGRPSLAGAWEHVGSLVPLADQCDGAMLKSDLLGAAAYLSVLRGDYELGAGLAEKAAALAADFRLKVPHAFCLLYLASAEIGRGALGHAEATLRTVEQGECAQRDNVRITAAATRLKLALARRDGSATPDPLALAAAKAGRSSRGLYAALSALAAAVAGDSARCRELAEEAMRLTRGAEAAFVARYAMLVARLPDDGGVEPEELADLLQETVDADIPNTFVTAYRAAPELLELAAAHPVARATAQRIVRGAHDHELARRIGLLADGERGATPLTPRELEVLRLLAEGLTNADIARVLFLSPRTVKVHVHHILEKLGSKSRLEAALKGQEVVAATAGGKETG